MYRVSRIFTEKALNTFFVENETMDFFPLQGKFNFIQFPLQGKFNLIGSNLS